MTAEQAVQFEEMAGPSCKCACGNEHHRRVARCQSFIIHPWRGKLSSSYDDKVLRCRRPLGHSGDHEEWYDFISGMRWTDAEQAT